MHAALNYVFKAWENAASYILSVVYSKDLLKLAQGTRTEREYVMIAILIFP
jgi:hypothetical protein